MGDFPTFSMLRVKHSVMHNPKIVECAKKKEMLGPKDERFSLALKVQRYTNVETTMWPRT